MAPLYVLLVSSAGLLVLAGLTGRAPGQQWPTALRFGLAAMLVVTGASHVVGLRDDLVAMVPPALPAPALLVTLTGLLELGGALALLWRHTAAWSAAGLGALLLAVLPANVHAAVSELQVHGEPAMALPLRAGVQLVYVAAAAAVWATHRRAARPPHITVTLPTVAGPNGRDHPAGAVLVSRLELRRLRDVPRFLGDSLRLRRTFRASPGAVSLRLAARPLTGVFWTWSRWTDGQAMAAYTGSEEHRRVMTRYRGRLQDSRFEALAAGGPLPRTWREARSVVAAPGRARSTRHGGDGSA